MIATGADPVVPPIPGLRQLEGFWGTREATGMKAIPRRLLVVGGGPAGVELAQVVRRLGGEAAIVERGDRLLPREPAPLGESLGQALRREGIELVLGAGAIGAGYDDGEYTMTLDNGNELRGDRLLVATGRRPRVSGIELETVGVDPNPSGIAVDERLSAGERLWAIGDVTGIWPLTSVGEYQGDIVAANVLGEPRSANYDAVPRVTFTNPQVASVGVADDRFSSTTLLTEESKLATYTRAPEHSNGFLTLLSDGGRLTGAYALGPEAGEWLQQSTVAIRARIPLDVLRDTIQPFPRFSRIYWAALTALQRQITAPPALARRSCVSPRPRRRSARRTTTTTASAARAIARYALYRVAAS